MKYTVILLRPDYLCDDDPYGQNIYVALVEVEGLYLEAVEKARAEVFAADTKDGMEPRDMDDYALCVLFEGHQDPKLFGWQL